jgi:hypothetical protein
VKLQRDLNINLPIALLGIVNAPLIDFHLNYYAFFALESNCRMTFMPASHKHFAEFIKAPSLQKQSETLTQFRGHRRTQKVE